MRAFLIGRTGSVAASGAYCFGGALALLVWVGFKVHEASFEAESSRRFIEANCGTGAVANEFTGLMDAAVIRISDNTFCEEPAGLH